MTEVPTTLELLPQISHLSQDAISMMVSWVENHKYQNLDRPDWDSFFLKLVDDVAERSGDAQFHAGAIIVDNRHNILSVGYNGHVADIEDKWLPNMRPEKYDFMLHAELNAILNCEHRPRGATIYTNGHPCLHCYQCCVQAGIVEIVCTDEKKATMIDKQMDAKLEIMKWLTRHKTTVRYANKGRGTPQ